MCRTNLSLKPAKIWMYRMRAKVTRSLHKVLMAVSGICPALAQDACFYHACQAYYLGVDCTVIVLQADYIILDPNKQVSVDARHDVDESGQGEHNVGEEDNCQGELQAEMPPAEALQTICCVP